MSTLLTSALALAATLFIAVSATMNAIFLSSFGRTPVETALLVGVSIAADVVKAALPVVLARALLLRAWTHAAAATGMLLTVTALSLASGTGFAALTRDASTVARDALAEELAGHRQDLRELDGRMAGLAQARPLAVIDADMAALQTDRRWSISKLCAEPQSAAQRQFCADWAKLKSERATAGERDRVTAERRETRARIEKLQASGAGMASDPQASAIASLFGVDRTLPRLVLTTSIAVVLELGSLLLVLLVAGPALLGWREPGTEPKPPVVPAVVPPSADRSHWHRERNKANLNGGGGSGHAR